ncbi:MAG: hypothetical protein KC613_20960, partial [Myxococcales bacterium]|nr:hypothetical protein [Myxococcales bacterium]
GDRALCQTGCTQLIACAEEFGGDPADVAEFAATCVDACVAEATAAELACVEAAFGDCGEMFACIEGIGGGEGGAGGAGGFGGGIPGGEGCDLFCSIFEECGAGTADECLQVCQQGAFPAEVLQCVEQNQDAGCDALFALCGE